MKKIKSIFAIITIISITTIGLSACNNNCKKENASEEKACCHKDKGNKAEAKTDTFACPMHPEEHSSQQAKCGKCGMDFVKK